MNKSQEDLKNEALDNVIAEKSRFNGNYESWFLTEEEEKKKQEQQHQRIRQLAREVAYETLHH